MKHAPVCGANKVSIFKTVSLLHIAVHLSKGRSKI